LPVLRALALVKLLRGGLAARLNGLVHQLKAEIGINLVGLAGLGRGRAAGRVNAAHDLRQRRAAGLKLVLGGVFLPVVDEGLRKLGRALPWRNHLARRGNLAGLLGQHLLPGHQRVDGHPAGRVGHWHAGRGGGGNPSHRASPN
jgi:hypothetical protein